MSLSRRPRRRDFFASNERRNADSAKPRLRKKWRVFYVIWNAFKRTCMLLGFTMVLLSVISIGLSYKIMSGISAVNLPDEMVLYMELKGDIVEYGGASGAYGLPAKSITMKDLTQALYIGAADDRVKGLVASVKGGTLNFTQVQELRQAIAAFRESGKFSYIYAPSYGGTGHGLGIYYLAAAFEEIWMQPIGMMSIEGLKAEMPFARDALDKLGVEPDFFARKEYKSVFENFTRNGMSDENREALGAVIADLGLQMSEEIAADREMTPDRFRALVERGIYTDKAALKAGLVDRLDYSDVLTEEIKHRAVGDADSEDLKFVDIGLYSKTDKNDIPALRSDAAQPKVALLYIVGTIMQSSSKSSDDTSSADHLSTVIGSITEDESYEAIVVRIDSPGGSPTASETIRRALVRAQEKGKKIIVSMGYMTASGGYWIAAPADHIFAMPSTLTGSIGVAGGKFVLAELWGKLGIHWEDVQWGENADFWSFNEKYSDTERVHMDAMMDQIYDGFVERVAEGRGMTVDEVDKVARGRVWTGIQAYGLDLVDDIGGLDDTLDFVGLNLGVENRHGLAVDVFPKPKTTFEQLTAILENQVHMGQTISTYSEVIDVMVPSLADTLQRVKASEGVTIYEPLPVLP